MHRMPMVTFCIATVEGYILSRFIFSRCLRFVCVRYFPVKPFLWNIHRIAFFGGTLTDQRIIVVGKGSNGS